jgi:hypothetical protein
MRSKLASDAKLGAASEVFVGLRLLAVYNSCAA